MSTSKLTVKIWLYICLISLVACQASTKDNWPIVNLWDLMISESELPSNWQTLEISEEPIVSFGEEDAALILFYYEGNPKQLTRGGFTLYRHDTIKWAISQYQTQERGHFIIEDRDYNTPMFIPDGFTFTSTIANEWRFRCVGYRADLLDERINCSYLARYAQYVVFFSIATTYQDEETIDIATIQNLIEVVDSNMQNLHSTLNTLPNE